MVETTTNGTGPQTYLEWGDTTRPDGYDYSTNNTTEQATDAIAKIRATGWTGPIVTGDTAYADQRRAERIAHQRALHAEEDREIARITNTPKIGAGATMHLPGDKYGYVVVAISKTGAVATLARLESPSTTTGHQPSGECNGFPVWDHTYTNAELVSMKTAHTERATRRADGSYYASGVRVTFARARYYRNYAD